MYETTYQIRQGVTRAAALRPQDPEEYELWKQTQRQIATEQTLADWQREWHEARYGRWTHRLLPSLAEWLKYAPDMDYHTVWKNYLTDSARHGGYKQNGGSYRKLLPTDEHFVFRRDVVDGTFLRAVEF